MSIGGPVWLYKIGLGNNAKPMVPITHNQRLAVPVQLTLHGTMLQSRFQGCQPAFLAWRSAFACDDTQPGMYMSQGLRKNGLAAVLIRALIATSSGTPCLQQSSRYLKMRDGGKGWGDMGIDAMKGYSGLPFQVGVLLQMSHQAGAGLGHLRQPTRELCRISRRWWLQGAASLPLQQAPGLSWSPGLAGGL